MLPNRSLASKSSSPCRKGAAQLGFGNRFIVPLETTVGATSSTPIKARINDSPVDRYTRRSSRPETPRRGPGHHHLSARVTS
jgi:hypothetical protein